MSGESLLAAQFERCKPWIEDALARDIGAFAIEHVWAALKDGSAQLWPTKNAVIVTVIETWPTGLKTLKGWLAGGNLDEVQMGEPVIRQWAADNGCDKILIGGRRGWLRALDGYDEAYTVMAKDLR